MQNGKISKVKKGAKPRPEYLSGNAITPGTTFMLDITVSLAFYIVSRLIAQRYKHLSFELSDGTVPVSQLFSSFYAPLL